MAKTASIHKLFREELLNLDDCKLARWKQPSKHRFPPLDEDEKAWIERFNAGLREPNLAEALFRAEVLVG